MGSRVLTTKVRRPGAPGGLVRDRLLDLLPTFADRRLVLVVAPAGAGKTTLLSQFLARSEGVRVWYRADAGDRSPDDLLRHLRVAARHAGLVDADGWRTPADLVCGFEKAGEITVAIDDLHTLNGSEAMDALAWILEYAPETTTILAASRSTPDLPLPKLRVAGEVVELDADDLRFRTWETEALFRTVYEEPLPPEELALLTRRTQGWAAGLQLYHLAITGKPGRERRQMLEGLRGGSTLLREYLTADVLDDLEPELRDFLLRTCVLGSLTPQLCDELLGTTDSASRLRELASRQIFTQRIDPAPTYRYHEVMRSYLEAVLFEERDGDDISKRYRRAGELLLEAGHHAEALRAFCHGEAWDEAGAVVRESGLTVSTRSGDWIDDLPESFVADDPWLLLVRARRQVAAGRFRSALQTYRAAEEAGGPTHAVGLCVDERLRLSAWLSREPVPMRGTNAILRAATRNDPLGSLDRCAERGGPWGALTQVVLATLGGDVRTATARASEVIDDLESTSTHVAMAKLLLALGAWLRGSPVPRDEIVWSTDTLEQLGMVWPARIGSALLALCDPPALETAGRIRREQERLDNKWGTALVRLLEGLGRIGEDRSASVLDGAAEAFVDCDAPVLEAWARSAAALARAGEGQSSRREIDRAHSFARAHDVPGALLLAAVAGSLASDAAPHHAGLAEDLERRLGISVDHLRDRLGGDARDGDDHDPEGAIRLRCLGRFELRTERGVLDIENLKPQVRLGLYFLAINVGRPIHREEIAEAFWPDSAPETAVRNVQVLISSLRSALGDVGAATIVRRGEAYEFVLPDDLTADFRQLERFLERARQEGDEGDRGREREALERALALFGGPMLPEAGPQDWLASPRRRIEGQAADAAKQLAELHLDVGDVTAAVRAAERGLEIDRFDDRLWQLLMVAHDRAGDVAAFSLARDRYAEALRELDLDPETVLGTTSR